MEIAAKHIGISGMLLGLEIGGICEGDSVDGGI